MPKESVADKEQYEKVYEHLKRVRASTTVEIKPTPMMRTEIRGFDGNLEPLKTRYYQVQGIYHLLVMNRMVLGDSTGTGKTFQAIGALCYIWERDPEVKVIVVCPKSAIGQWSSEIDKFAIGVKTFQVTGTLDKRKEVYQGWSDHKGPAVLILNYALVIRDWDQGITKADPPPGAKKGTVVLAGRGYLDELTSKMSKLSVIFDEIQACKNPTTKTHQTCKLLADRCKRVWGLTATLLQNHLIEGFGIYKVIRPQTFGSKSGFLNTYCVTEMQRVRGGGKIPIIVGYKNLANFRETIDPFFYGRQKHEICKELPALTTREVICDLSPAEDRKYQEALSGVFELGTGEIKDYTETKQMTSLIYIQEICNSLSLVKFGEDEFDRPVTSTEGRSSKETALVDLLSEELDGEKVIVYTRFKSHLPRLQAILTKEGIKSVVISGDVTKASARKAAQDKFQDPNSKIRVIFITDAGSESINLQMASAMIFFDSPWSWGKYVQILGRLIRIGSPHQAVFAIHLLAKRPGTGKKTETIDHKVIQKLRKKKGLIDQVIGQAAVGALKFERNEDVVRELISSLRETVKK
jgi:SNF2 family DNA or RNA helicase